jgi:protein-disulfide isomerase
VFDEPVYDEDLLPEIGAQLYKLKTQEYEIKNKALANLLDQRLLEREAKSRGLSTEAFLEQTVYRNLPAPSALEIEAYYLAQKDRLNNRPLSEIRPQIEKALIHAKRQQARQDYLDQLKQKASVSILLSRPRVAVAVDPGRLRGNPDAPVTIVEFADFQCPYCGAAEAPLKQVLEKYHGKVQFSFRDFPLREIHPQAQPAAEASRCAGDQGQFWEYHDVLFANQADLKQSVYREHARKIGLDVTKFQACLDSGSFKPLIESDLQSGMAAGVSGTPAFYINGVMIDGARPASEFESIIDSELARTKPANSAQ